MTMKISGMFTFADRLQMAALNFREKRSEVIASNISNAETPGFRALGYGFEDQLQTIAKVNDPLEMKISNPKHMRHEFAYADGKIMPDVYVRPTESVPEDGNTVDVDLEMANLAKNQIQFRMAVESLNRKVGMLKYAINGGR